MHYEAAGPGAPKARREWSGHPRRTMCHAGITRSALLIISVSLLGQTGSAQNEGVTPVGQSSSAGRAATETAGFDHAAFDALLKRHVTADGQVDYTGLARDSADLDAYIAALGKAPLDQLSRDEQLALLINAYNAFTLRLILDYYPLRSIKDIPRAKRWKHRRWNLDGRRLSLDELEHKLLRPRFHEPRVHFAVNCASVGCPPLRNEAYVAARLEEQLQAQSEYVHRRQRWFRFDRTSGKVYLTRVYDWYGRDFERREPGSVLAFAARFSPELKRDLDAGRAVKIKWLDWDWSLNAKRQADQEAVP